MGVSKNPNFDPSIGKKTQFKKGVSGNPSGRNLFPLTAILKELGESKKISYNVTLENENGEKKVKKGKITTAGSKQANMYGLVGVKLFQKAVGGDLKAAEIIMDRVEGKATQRTEIITPDRDPLALLAERLKREQEDNDN